MANVTNGVLPHRERTAFAFRGYNVTNLGRTPELLAHPVYNEIVEQCLREASQICSDVTRRPVDLVARVREARETRGLEDYADDVALIVAVEIAQIRLLEAHFGVELPRAKLAFGYSLGECSALIATGVYEMKDLLPVALAMADDCAALAREVTLAIMLSRGPVLDFDAVRRLCLEISQHGRGVIDTSTYLSPNSLLLMGQNGAIKDMDKRIRQEFAGNVALRTQQAHYPPLHTSIMWQRSIPNRMAVLLQTAPGGFRAPSLPIVSMVTGQASYDDFNSRDLMHRWVDHPQRLWEVVYKVLADGVETVVHVGPNPNLLPAIFRRLSNNIQEQTRGSGLGSFGRRQISRLVKRPWLTRLLPSSAVLFRAPLVQHIILEDWLLSADVKLASRVP